MVVKGGSARAQRCRRGREGDEQNVGDRGARSSADTLASLAESISGVCTAEAAARATDVKLRIIAS